jgi:hypothetical protein
MVPPLQPPRPIQLPPVDGSTTSAPSSSEELANQPIAALELPIKVNVIDRWRHRRMILRAAQLPVS